MKYKKVLLLNFAYRESFFIDPKILAGLGYVAQALETAGVDYQVLDMNLGYTFDQLRERVRAYAPDLLGVTLMTFRYKDNYAALARLKEEFPSLAIAAGGPHVSLFRGKVLEDCQAIDYGVVLEGERTITELCAGADPAGIPGLVRRDGGRAVFNGERPFSEDLDAIPFPRYARFELDKYPRPGTPNAVKDIPIVSSRGCPFKCIYCPVISAIGARFRCRSAANIVAEIRWWYDQGYRTFWFTDDNFTLLEKRVYEFCDAIEASGMTGLMLGCGNGIRADRVDRALLARMKRAGFTRIAFGVEAGNDKVLRTLKKGETMAQIERSIADATELGFLVSLFFLLGSPGETEADVRDSFALARRYPIEEAMFYHLIPFPKTELYGWIEENGYFLIQPSDYLSSNTSLMNQPVFATPELPEADRKRLYLEAKGVSADVRLANYARKFRAAGVPAPLTRLCARVYTTKAVQDLAVRTDIGGKLRGLARRLLRRGA